MKIPTAVCRNHPPILVPFSQISDELRTQPDELNDRPNGIQKHQGSRPRPPTEASVPRCGKRR